MDARHLINVLAHTSANGSWILPEGDSAHDWRIVTNEDKDAAEEYLRRMRALLRVPKVPVLIAHGVPWYEANKGEETLLPGVIPAFQSSV